LNQIEFVNLIVDHLTGDGAMKPELLYESPFTDLTPQGPDGLFAAGQVDELVALLNDVRDRAQARQAYRIFPPDRASWGETQKLFQFPPYSYRAARPK